MRLKDLVTVRNIKTDRTDLPYIALENIQSWDGTYVPSAIETEGTNSMYFAGDVLFGKLRPYLAKAYIPDNDGICSTEFLVMKTGARMNNQFLKYFLLSPGFIDHIKNQVAGVKMPRTNWNEIGGLSVNVPDVEKQQEVVAYLNNEIDSINKRIWLRERELQTLINLKRSEIDAVVTRGLNPNVKMKDSGIEWIGQIPEHWKVRKLKNLITFMKSGGTPASGNPDYYIDEGTPWVAISDMSNVDVVTKTTKTLSDAAIADKGLEIFPAGTILYSIYASIGKVATLGVPATINQAILAMSFKKSCDEDYMKMQLRAMESFVFSLANGNTQYNLNAAIVSNIFLLVPPLEEQRQIAAYLQDRCSRIDAIYNNINLQIEKLQLLKKSLINEVITGQRAI